MKNARYDLHSMAIAKISPADGGEFDAEIANLTPSSVFLKTDRTFQFRDSMKLEFFGIKVKAEVVYVSKVQPLGVGVVFRAKGRIAEIIQRECDAFEATNLGPEDPESAGIDAFLSALESGALMPDNPMATGSAQAAAQLPASGNFESLLPPWGGQYGQGPAVAPPGANPQMPPGSNPQHTPVPQMLSYGPGLATPMAQSPSYGAGPPSSPHMPMQPPSTPSAVALPRASTSSPSLPIPSLAPGRADSGTIPPRVDSTPPMSALPMMDPAMLPPSPMLGAPPPPGMYAPPGNLGYPGYGYPPDPGRPPSMTGVPALGFMQPDLTRPPSSAGLSAPHYMPQMGSSYGQPGLPPPGYGAMMPPSTATGIPAIPHSSAMVPQLPPPRPQYQPLPTGLGDQAQQSINELLAELEASAGGDTPSTPPPEPAPEFVGLRELDAEGSLTPSDALDAFAVCASMLAGRPVVLHGQPSSPEAKLVLGDLELALTVQPFGPGLVQVMAAQLNALRRAATALFAQVDAASFEPPPPEPDASEVPELDGESVVRFQSFMHFVVQHRINLTKGAMVVKADNIPPGTQRSLRLSIPGISDEVTVSGSVAFQGAGTIGFMIDNPDSVATKLADIAALNPAKVQKTAAQVKKTVAPKSGTRSIPAARGVSWSGRTQLGQTVSDVFEFDTTQTRTLDDCNGWLVSVLQHLFKTNVHGVVTFEKDGKRIKVWSHNGSLVFSQVEPEVEDDQLGRVLVLQKKISRASLSHGLERAKESKQPLGRTLVGMGEIEPGALNAALRQQILDRVFKVREWDGATISVGPWVDPEVRTGLVMTSGKAIVTNLLREAVRRATAEELEEFCEPYFERTLKVQLEKIDPSFGLRRKERKFYEKSAMSNVALRDIPKVTAVSPVEAQRMIVLGRGLGLVDSGDAAAERTQEEIDGEVIAGLDETLTEMREGDHFDVLGVHWTSTDRAIPTAYKKRIAKFEKLLGNANAKIRNRAEQALDLVEVAYEALATADKRTEYRNEIVPDYERKQSADHMIDQAELLILKDDIKGAEQILRTAQEIFMTPRIDTLFNSLRGGRA